MGGYHFLTGFSNALEFQVLAGPPPKKKSENKIINGFLHRFLWELKLHLAKAAVLGGLICGEKKSERSELFFSPQKKAVFLIGLHCSPARTCLGGCRFFELFRILLFVRSFVVCHGTFLDLAKRVGNETENGKNNQTELNKRRRTVLSVLRREPCLLS